MMPAKVAAGVVGLAIIVTGFVVVPLSMGEAGDQRYSAYGTDHTSLSQARRALADVEGSPYDIANVGTSPMILRDVDPEATILFVVAMERPYASYEMAAMDSFLERGGHIVLLDDGAYGNQYSTRHGIEFLRASVLDEFSHNKSFVWAEAGIAGEQHNVLLAGPVALEDVNATDTTLQPFIVNYGFLDLNGDGKIDAIDKGGLKGSTSAQPINIGIRRDFPGGGRLTVMSDSGWIVDDMLERVADVEGQRNANVVFLRALVADALGPQGGLVLFDESRRGTQPLESGIYQAEKGLLGLFRSVPAIGVLFTAAMMVLLVILLMQIPGREDWHHRHRPDALVRPPEEGRRHLLRQVLERQVRISGGIGAIRDDVVRQAASEPDNLRDDDIDLVLDRIRQAMQLELKPLQDDDIPT